MAYKKKSETAKQKAKRLLDVHMRKKHGTRKAKKRSGGMAKKRAKKYSY